eukprot:403368172
MNEQVKFKEDGVTSGMLFLICFSMMVFLPFALYLLTVVLLRVMSNEKNKISWNETMRDAFCCKRKVAQADGFGDPNKPQLNQTEQPNVNNAESVMVRNFSAIDNQPNSGDQVLQQKDPQNVQQPRAEGPFANLQQKTNAEVIVPPLPKPTIAVNTFQNEKRNSSTNLNINNPQQSKVSFGSLANQQPGGDRQNVTQQSQKRDSVKSSSNILIKEEQKINSLGDDNNKMKQKLSEAIQFEVLLQQACNSSPRNIIKESDLKQAADMQDILYQRNVKGQNQSKQSAMSPIFAQNLNAQAMLSVDDRIHTPQRQSSPSNGLVDDNFNKEIDNSHRTEVALKMKKNNSNRSSSKNKILFDIDAQSNNSKRKN